MKENSDFKSININQLKQEDFLLLENHEFRLDCLQLNLHQGETEIRPDSRSVKLRFTKRSIEFNE